MTIARIELTEQGIALIDTDESRVEISGADAWELLKWLNWHVIELGRMKAWREQPQQSSKYGVGATNKGETNGQI